MPNEEIFSGFSKEEPNLKSYLKDGRLYETRELDKNGNGHGFYYHNNGHISFKSFYKNFKWEENHSEMFNENGTLEYRNVVENDISRSEHYDKKGKLSLQIFDDVRIEYKENGSIDWLQSGRNQGSNNKDKGTLLMLKLGDNIRSVFGDGRTKEQQAHDQVNILLKKSGKPEIL